MPRLDLDTAAFAASATAVRDAAATLRGEGSLGVPSSAVGDPVVAAALEDVQRAWTSDVRVLAGQLDDVAGALGTAGQVFADAESDVGATLATLLGTSR